MCCSQAVKYTNRDIDENKVFEIPYGPHIWQSMHIFVADPFSNILPEIERRLSYFLYHQLYVLLMTMLMQSRCGDSIFETGKQLE